MTRSHAAEARMLGYSLFLAIVLSNTACSTPVGLEKTPLSERREVVFQSLGVAIGLPAQPRHGPAQYLERLSDSSTYQKNSGNKASLALMMHPYWSGQPLTEPEHWLVFSVWRMSPAEFDTFKRAEHWANQSKFLGREPTEFQAEISERVVQEQGEWREYLCFRKDVRLPDGDIVVAVASLLHNTVVNPNEAEDIAAIKAILNSIQPLDADKPQ